MKQVKSLIALGISFSLIIGVVSCKKGDTGPAGPAGPAGAAGTAGAAGAAGPKGDTGVANVIYSAWLDAVYVPDTVHSGSAIDTVSFHMDATNITKLTNTILNTGDIKVYININTTTTPVIIAVPYWDPYTNLSIVPTYAVGEIYLMADADFSTVSNGGVKSFQWRYILIPGGTAGRSAINWKNYAEVKKYLNLKD